MSKTEAKQQFAPALLNKHLHEFRNFVPAKYPPLAMQARISGDVELKLEVDPTTGEVKAVTPLTGNLLLQRSAIEAAKQWVFSPNSSPEQVSATIRYDLSCPASAQ